MTSHDAVAFVRRVTGQKKVGHTGTLDPAAAGVLPICLGQATRLAEYLQAGTKEYIAEAHFGFETDSGDLLGVSLGQKNCAGVTRKSVEAALGRFRGRITQTPPLHSAVKVDGERLYDLARSGREAEIPTREVTISALTCAEFFAGATPRAVLRLECSGGTFVRSLVRDLARSMGTAATLSFLVRTRSGAFAIAEAVSPQEFEANPKFFSFAESAQGCGQANLQNEGVAERLAQGKTSPWPPNLPHPPGPARVLVRNGAQTLFALAEWTGPAGLLRAEKVFDLRADH